MERIEKLKAFLKQNENDEFIKHALALEYIKLGDEENAKALFIQVLDANPDYTGSYYHLAKLYERLGNNEEAIRVYEAGMVACKKNKDQHAYNELQAAHEDLVM